jgi:hypothetical protein
MRRVSGHGHANASRRRRLVSTASDYTAFVQALPQRGTRHGSTLLKPESIRLMISNQIGSVVVHEMPAMIPGRPVPPFYNAVSMDVMNRFERAVYEHLR